MDNSTDSNNKSVEYDNLFIWVKKRLEILGYSETMWSTSSNQAIVDFISGEGNKTLSITELNHKDSSKNSTSEYKVQIKCDLEEFSAPPIGTNAYFLRVVPDNLTTGNIDKCIQYGTIGGSGLSLESLERIMKGLVEKQISQNNELSSHYHRCMATLTDTIHYKDGRTVLYCPNFEFSSVSEAANDKDRLQIMESVVIHWTRQIKDVVNNHENSSTNETSGPLDEIEFWKVRAQDLLGIRKQLEVESVTKIISVLEYAKSNYIQPFKNRTEDILTKAAEANDNLKFLETIREQCTALRLIDAEKINTILPDLLHRIRLIWSYSSYYSNNDHIAGILRKISNEIIRRFRNHIPIDRIMEGDVEFCLARLLEAIECGIQWKQYYQMTSQAIINRNLTIQSSNKNIVTKNWKNIDNASIFAQIDAFVQRCRDLIDICESQIQFSRKSSKTKGQPGPLPKFGGTKSQEIIDGILGIQVSFESRIEKLKKLDYDILDVRISKWHDDYYVFKNGIKDLEVMYTNVITVAYENNSTIQEGVYYTLAFNSLAKRDVIKRCVEKKAAEILRMFLKQIQTTRSEFEKSRLAPPLRYHEPQYAGSALWANSLACIVKDSYEYIQKISKYLNKHDYDECIDNYTTLINVIKDFKLYRYNQWIDDLNNKAKDNGLQLRLDKPLLRRIDSNDINVSNTINHNTANANNKEAAIYSNTKNGVEIVCNFDEDLIVLFAEVSHWEKFHGEFSIPYIAHDICNKKENLRLMRESVMQVVKAYNDIINEINPEEKRLFIDFIKRLDKKINPGLVKITWQSKNLIELFVKDCCNHCNDILLIIKEYKEFKIVLNKLIKSVSNTILIKIDKNYIYENGVFEFKQKEFRLSMMSFFNNIYIKITTLLKSIYKYFKDCNIEVQKEWKSQINSIDRLIEQALKTCVKRSLQELSKAINGDSKTKTDPQTLFTIQIQLDSMKVTYLPSITNLTHSLNIVAKDIISVVTAIQRIRGQNFDISIDKNNIEKSPEKTVEKVDPVVDHLVLAESPHRPITPKDKHVDKSLDRHDSKKAAANDSTNNLNTNSISNSLGSPSSIILPSDENKLKSYHDIISDDSEIVNLLIKIMNGMGSTASELQKYLSYWDKYKSLWELDKETYFRKYNKSNRNPLQFEFDITKYKSLQTDISNETSTHNINFVRIDCNVLKDNLMSHCSQCQNKLTGLLNVNGYNELRDIFDLFTKTKENLTTPPNTLDELNSKMKLSEEIKEQLLTIRNRFDPVREIYQTLDKFEVVVKEEEIAMLNGLDNLYDEFIVTLADADKILDRSKISMKRELEVQMEAYGNSMIELKSTALMELPYNNENKSIDEALNIIESYKQKIIKAKEKEVVLSNGLSIFKIVSTEHKDLTYINKDIENLTAIWNVLIEFNNHWDTWKTISFNTLDILEMESILLNFNKKINKLGRDIKKWKIWEHMKAEIDKLKEILPLIQDLRNKALRPRHWNALQDKIGFSIDPLNNLFTLNEVMNLKLHLYQDFIGELSSNANKELAIEVALAELEEHWSTIVVEIGVYKDKYYKIKSTDALIQFLEDDSVALSSMKSSKFYSSFSYYIDDWEKTLGTISEVIDLLLNVQRKWIYLESIFLSGGDISKQLPQEYTLFVGVNNDFLSIMNIFENNSIAKQSCLTPGLLDKINSMDERLEKIQKSLDSYLETKRILFPRFYFVSDDDLLEILGQSKDPIAVQKHIKKCFEGIKSLKMIPPNTVIPVANQTNTAIGNNANNTVTTKTFEASHMIAPDGEIVQFVDNVTIDGAVELWLIAVERAMKRAIAYLLYNSVYKEFKSKKDKWIKDTIGQLLITTGSIMWTMDCHKSLLAISNGMKNALRQQKKKQVNYLNKLTTMIRSPLSKIERNKIVDLITMEIHNRDVLERMIKANCMSISDFEWLSQLRFFHIKETANNNLGTSMNSNNVINNTTNPSNNPTINNPPNMGNNSSINNQPLNIFNNEFGKCVVSQLSSTLEYSNEYQGNNGRLVVTPLTDRCVLTLITAMYLNRGGNPLGPAGTGKTETVKDLGKNLAKYVVVINCSDGMDYKSVGRIFSGLVQSGSWGCFDEFNRIKIEVISVVAMQISSILNALSSKVSSFSFMGSTIPCNPNTGIFITMNPGYAGRTELPDNLKALMRPVAMMAPDLSMIAEVILASEGFNEARVMAKKTVTLYSLMIQQLSKQDHYDYGLRNLKAVLNMAGQLKRLDITTPEETILMRALRDMNLPKFIKDDERLFRLLLGDLFPSLELPISEYATLRTAIENELNKLNYQKPEFLIQKMFQFYDSRKTRHCNMLVGDPYGGKSTVWKTLANATTSLAKQGVEGYNAVVTYVISPKSIELDELYGAYDLSTFEWKDGILSTIFKSCSEDDKPHEKWILFDGPIDALWIESMNSVMDDNKILTLINGDRIPLTNTMSLVFETQDLKVASPATVSRAGMVYIDAIELGWKTYTESWILSSYPNDNDLQQFYRDLFDKWLPKLLKFKELNCSEPIKLSDFVNVTNLCTLYTAICKQESNSFKKDLLQNDYLVIAEKLFLFAITWSIGSCLDEISRKKISVYMADIDAIGPVTNTLYDYYVDISKNDFIGWDTKVPNWRPLKNMTFHDMIVPTVDTIRNQYIVDTYLHAKKHTMVVGSTGTGKTVLCQSLLKELTENSLTYSQLQINFSAATTSNTVQDIIESSLEKRSKDKLGPYNGKNLIIFIDDFNMPRLTSFESPFQPPLELIRMWIDYNGWYDRIKCSWKYILDSQLLVSMGYPGGGRNNISLRTQSRFAILNCTFPSDSQIVRIFESILSSKFIEYENEIKQLSSGITIATLSVYKAVCIEFLATPEKFHYLFNLRDVAKVIQGILMGSRKSIYTPEGMLRLWIHECQRVFSDRFISSKSNDESKFRELLAIKISENLQKDWNSIISDSLDPKIGPLFCGFVHDNVGNVNDEDYTIIYEEITDYKKIRSIIEERLDDYNNEPKLIPMNLAMFRDAVMHVSRIHRVLLQPRGNLMLIGVGGSGRSSLTRLAAYIANMTLFNIEITKNYRLQEFREDIKKLYNLCGCENKSVVFLFTDTQIKEESFLEDINNILSSGIVPNLFNKDDFPVIYDAVRKPMLAQGLEDNQTNLWKFFIDRVRSNLHIVLTMSPIGSTLRNRCRMYPGLVNCTTIDWFHIWPGEALQEVSLKFLSQIEFNDSSYRNKISIIFADMHLSVINTSNRMLNELKRHNYVTPTNYLELVKGYISLLSEKRGELGASASKLGNGLAKLEDARLQVETLSKELELKKVIVAQSQKDCEDLLVQIVSERRVADEQKRHVEADSERISQEAIECKAISDDAEADLAIALPALEKAMEEVDKLDKNAISEVKAYAKPPQLVEVVLQAVMVLFNRPTDWGTAKRVLSESNFLQQIKSYDKDNITQSVVNKIKKFIDMPEFKPAKVFSVSSAAGALCSWVHAIYVYANVAKEVAPKRQRQKEAMESLELKQNALKDAQEALAIVTQKLAHLQVSYDNSVNEKNRLRDEAEYLEAKLDRADKLVNGLSGEYTRWQESIGLFNISLVKVTGDALLSAAFLSYAGPFESTYRTSLMKQWVNYITLHKLPLSDNYDFIKYLSKPTDIRDWNIQGLPKDDFSIENGVIATRGNRFPLIIDPQGQANRWIRNKESKNHLYIIDLKMTNYLRDIETAIQYGYPVLLQDILEDIDPALEPVLSKSILKVGNRSVIKLGDKEIDYSDDFKLYITTKLSNPHYTPEISTKVTVINFTVKKDGLEAQLLGIIVQKEDPSSEKKKNELTILVAKGKRQLVELEDEILKLLSESKGSLLDDEGLVNTLQQSKITSEEVTNQLIIAEETERKIDIARLSYRPSAIRAALAYFVIDDMSHIDNMYQFSLDSYVTLFNLSIDNSHTTSLDIPISKRCEDINNYHTLAVYKYTCRGLFKAHKLLFSLQLCFKIMESLGNLNQEEFSFFSIGSTSSISQSSATTNFRSNPCSEWLPSNCWETIIDLDKLPNFQGIVSSFEQMPRDWKAWYLSSKPELEQMPGDWTIKTSDLQKLCLLRALRFDRVLYGCSKFIASNIGNEYVDPPSFDIESVYQTSNCQTPLIFILSPGVDPTSSIYQLANSLSAQLTNCALGQGQAPIATELIEQGIKKGTWVYLANCHLMLSWMNSLEKLIQTLIVENKPHKDFRLWLSSSPDPNFPISILQNSIKITTEPPKGLRSNLLTLYNGISEEQFSRCTQQEAYKKLLFSLVWFHSILLERRKFKSLGFNISYDFNESDFSICHDLIIAYLDKYPDKYPYDAMKYLIAEANYGGRVTDDWDRRLVNVYISELINEECVSSDKFMLSSLPDYYIPKDGDLKYYKDFIKGLPATDHPLAFGQHPNSDMSASIDDTNVLIQTLVSLQPRIVKVIDEDAVDPLVQQCSDLLESCPEVFDIKHVKEKLDTRADPDPLKTILFQELDRYNKLLSSISSSLSTIIKVTQGTASVTSELEDVMLSLGQLKVPRQWGTTYPSLKPLGSWYKDLKQRIDFFNSWIEESLPVCWWLPAMTYPSGFLTAILQVSARQNGLSIDSLSYDTPILTSGDKNTITSMPKDGVYVYGLFIEGGIWNYSGGYIEESRPMELISTMPIIHFKPIEGKRRGNKGYYTCPIYMYPFRSGSRERPSYVIAIELKVGKFTSDFWTKRGVALLLSTSL